MEIIKKIIDYGKTKEQLRYGMLVTHMAMIGACLGFVIGTLINPDSSESGFVLLICVCISLILISMSIIVKYLLRGDRADDIPDTAGQVYC